MTGDQWAQMVGGFIGSLSTILTAVLVMLGYRKVNGWKPPARKRRPGRRRRPGGRK